MLEARISVTRGSFALDVDLRAEGVVAVLGPNGSGKTTLLRALLGAQRPRLGRIALDGRVLFDRAAGVEVPVEERSIAYVPQGQGLFPHLSALENVLFGMRGDDRRARALELLGELELRGAADRRPSELSGGERQRVALARALAVRPLLLLLDEPLAALDGITRPRVREFLATWLRTAGLSALVVTHDPVDARALASDVLVLDAGRIAQRGAPDELAARPETDLVRALAPGLRGG